MFTLNEFKNDPVKLNEQICQSIQLHSKAKQLSITYLQFSFEFFPLENKNTGIISPF